MILQDNDTAQRCASSWLLRQLYNQRSRCANGSVCLLTMGKS